jgi:hypothetical protein
MKEYTYIVINLATGESQVLEGHDKHGPLWPGFNPRSSYRRRVFQHLTMNHGGGWRPVREIPMGGTAQLKTTNTPVSESILVLMERVVDQNHGEGDIA